MSLTILNRNSWILYVLEIDLLQTFRHQISVIQRDAILWLQEVIPKCTEVKSLDYMAGQ